MGTHTTCTHRGGLSSGLEAKHQAAHHPGHREVEVGRPCSIWPWLGVGAQDADDAAAWDGVLIGAHLLGNLLYGPPIVPAQAAGIR